MITIFTLIALQNNNNWLTQRSLPSIVNQTHNPDHLLLIDDSLDQPLSNIQSLFSNIPSQMSLTYLKNCRTSGFSGAWNTGLAYIVDNYCHDSDNTYISIMMEPYQWSKNHIKSCVKYALDKKDVIISGIVQRDKCETRELKIHKHFTIYDILNQDLNIHPPGIFLRLSSLLEAGLFDERMHSFIIDDLCIRLSEINVSTISTNNHSVNLYVDSKNKCLSKKEKKSLQQYYQKYHCRMTASQKKAFQQSTFIVENKAFSKPVNKIETDKQISFQLVVGVISGNAAQLLYLLEDLFFLQSIPCIASLNVLILENGGDEQSLTRLTSQINAKGLSCFLITHSQQKKDASNGSFGISFNRNNEQLCIGKARTLLQRYLYEYVKNDINSIVWILDDDMRLNEKTEKYLPTLPKFKEQGVDILIGTFEGASPNPSTSGMRVQLVDLLNNIKWLNSMNNDDTLADRSEENRTLRNDFPDYYYDLSRMHTAHLETVYWLTPNFKGETVFNARNNLLNNLDSLFVGSSLLRPLIIELPADPLNAAEDSVNRGGNTFILNPMALINAPNAIVSVLGKEARRSDMMWALINRYYYGMNIKKVNFTVIHNRCIFDTVELCIQKTVGEIQGSSIHAALKDVLKPYHKASFIFDDDMVSTVCKAVNEYMNKRLSSFQLNFYRIQGLCRALNRIDKKNEMKSFLNKLSSFYVDRNLNAITNGVKELSSDYIKEYLHSLKIQIDSYKHSELDATFLKGKIIQPV